MFTANEYEMSYYFRMTPGRWYNCILKIEDLKKSVASGTWESVFHFGLLNKFIASV